MGHICPLLFQTIAYQNCSWVDWKGRLTGDQSLNSSSRIQKPPICPSLGSLSQSRTLYRKGTRTEESVCILRGRLVACLKVFSFEDIGHSNHRLYRRVTVTAWLGFPEAEVWMWKSRAGTGDAKTDRILPRRSPPLEQPLSPCVWTAEVRLSRL